MQDLSDDEHAVLEEFYSRMTREHDRVAREQIMAFWNTLDEYKNSFPRGTEEWSAKDWIEDYKWNVMRYELPHRPHESKTQLRSRLGNEFHKNSIWRYVPEAILECGLPKLQMQPDGNDGDATAHIIALAKFARDLANWLRVFATRMLEYRDTDEYKRESENSAVAREQRAKRQRKDKGKGKGKGKGKS